MVKIRLLLFDREIDQLDETGWTYEILYTKESFYLVEVDIPRKELAKGNRRIKGRPYIHKGKKTMR